MTSRPPDRFVPWPHPSPVLDRLGPFFQRHDDPRYVGFFVDEPKLNARRFLHAGILATFGDVAIGHALAASTDPPTPLLTVHLTCDYTGTAAAGDWVEGEVTTGAVGRRLARGSITFRTTNRVIGEVRGLFIPAKKDA